MVDGFKYVFFLIQWKGWWSTVTNYLSRVWQQQPADVSMLPRSAAEGESWIAWQKSWPCHFFFASMQRWMWSQSASKDFLCVAFSTVNVNVGLSQMFIRIPLWHPKWSYLDISFTCLMGMRRWPAPQAALHLCACGALEWRSRSARGAHLQKRLRLKDFPMAGLLGESSKTIV